MHTDVAGFTAVSERIDPIELSAMMNDYFLTIGQPVTRREGFFSDQTGDTMLAIWAAAEPDIHLPYQACEAALDISEALVGFHATARYPALYTRIGLHAGRIAVGGIRMGATEHYRTFGVIVNTAQRIQGLNKVLRTTNAGRCNNAVVTTATTVNVPSPYVRLTSLSGAWFSGGSSLSRSPVRDALSSIAGSPPPATRSDRHGLLAGTALAGTAPVWRGFKGDVDV